MNKKHLWNLLAIMMVAMLSVGFTSCGDDDDEGGSVNSDLVGTWTKQYDRLGVIGLKLTSNGEAYYNEWSTGETPNFDNVKSPARFTVSGSIIRFTHPQEKGYYEEYTYTLSEDKKQVTFSLVDRDEDSHGLSAISGGTFTKYE